MNKIISMNHSCYGDKDLQTIELTPLERLDAKLKVAKSLQKQSQFPQVVEKGFEMSGDVFVALVDFANSDPAHILNAQTEVDWKVEAKAQEADYHDWQDQITELRGG